MNLAFLDIESIEIIQIIGRAYRELSIFLILSEVSVRAFNETWLKVEHLDQALSKGDDIEPKYYRFLRKLISVPLSIKGRVCIYLLLSTLQSPQDAKVQQTPSCASHPL